MATAIPPHVDYLGGPNVIGPIADEFDLVEAVQAGLPTEAIDDLVARRIVSSEEVDRLLIPRRTLRHRKQHQERLTLEESDRLSRVARTLAYAAECFGSAEKAGRWMRRPRRTLRGQVPLELLATSDGTRLVEDELTRIASGDLA